MAPWLHALVLVLFLNAAFLGLAVWAASVPREPLRDRVRSAFVTMDLVEEDYLDFDSRRGYHQYDECLILQMLVNPTDSSLRQAVGPVLFVQDTTATGYCRTLRRLVVEEADPSEFLEEAYTRYWHGYIPVAAGFLTALDLATARRALKAISYLSLALLATVAALSRCGPVRVVGLSVALSGLFLWGLPYFGQLFSHAVGDILVVLGLVGLVAFRKRLRYPTLFVPFCAAYGACVVYLEFLTGQLPIAGGLFFGTAYAVAICGPDPTRREAWRYAGTGLAAFGLGAGATVIVKQGLAAAILGGQALSSFMIGLAYYTGSASSRGSGLPSLVRALRRLLQKVDILTYGDETAAILVAVFSVLAWLAAAVLAVRNDAKERRFQARSDYLALVAGVAVVAIWVLLFQKHTYAHAVFMVRISIVPIAFGWAALLWQLRARPRRA